MLGVHTKENKHMDGQTEETTRPTALGGGNYHLQLNNNPIQIF